MRFDFDLIVIGSGAGGSTGAHYAASLGKKVAVIERLAIGGECPNYACVPTKALLHVAELYDRFKQAGQYGIETGAVRVDYAKTKQWKNLVVSRTGAAKGSAAFTEDGITFIRGKATFIDKHRIKVADQVYTAKHFLIATGSEVFIPPIPGLAEAGYLTYKEAVDLANLPRSLFIIGGGPIGCEFTQIFSAFGTKVYLADSLPRLLAKDDPEVSELVTKLFVKRSVTVLTGVIVSRVEARNKQKIISFTDKDRTRSVEVEAILVASGKRPVLDIGLEQAGVKVGKQGIIVNSYLQTSHSHIYAAGDVVGPYLFTHTGYYQSYIAAHNAFSRHKLVPDYTVVPRCVFTSPEVASVGLSEAQAKEKKIKIKKGLAPINILGRANTSNETEGFVKIITDTNEKIIGASIVAPRAGEMIHQLALAIKLKAKASDVASMIHAFPTFSEAIKIACAIVE